MPARAGLSCFPQHSFTRQCPIPPAKRVIVSTFERSMSMIVLDKRGAPNVDSEPQGTSLRDFVLGTDFTRMPEELG